MLGMGSEYEVKKEIVVDFEWALAFLSSQP